MAHYAVELSTDAASIHIEAPNDTVPLSGSAKRSADRPTIDLPVAHATRHLGGNRLEIPTVILGWPQL